MRELMLELDWRKRLLTWWGLVSAAVVAMLLVVHTSAPTVQAQEQKADPASQATPTPPPGDCWNGALSGDPLHCYILEEAQRAGKIDVAAVYLAPGGGPLYIFLSQTEPIDDDEVGSFLQAKAYEYLESVTSTGRYPTHKCDGRTGDARSGCFDEILERPHWRAFGRPLGGGLPDSRAYSNVLLEVGGVEARRSKLGWASWSEVWPVGAGVRSEEGASGASSGFDVSDVDITNIPELDCNRDFPGTTNVMFASCLVWTEDGIAGLQSNPTFADKLYYQVKSPLPDSEEGMEALRKRLSSLDLSNTEVEIILVKYDLGQLWRWNVILDRFARSASNTVGILGAQVGINYEAYTSESLVWLNGVAPAERNEWGKDWSTVRNILIVWTLDKAATVAALPGLLPELGIPADAVGLVARSRTTPIRSNPLGPEPVDMPGPASKTEIEVSKSQTVSTDSAGSKVSSPPKETYVEEAQQTDSAGSKVSSPPKETYVEEAQQTDSAGLETDTGTGSVAAGAKTVSETSAERKPQSGSVVMPTGGAVSDVQARASETDRVASDSDVSPAGAMASSTSAISMWALIGVAGAVALVAVGSAVFVGARVARRRT